MSHRKSCDGKDQPATATDQQQQPQNKQQMIQSRPDVLSPEHAVTPHHLPGIGFCRYPKLGVICGQDGLVANSVSQTKIEHDRTLVWPQTGYPNALPDQSPGAAVDRLA